MGKQLYFECASGISGDMAVAALLDLGASEAQLQETLATLPITEAYEIRISRVKKSGLDTCDFDVILPKDLDTHDHDMAYLYGHLQEKILPMNTIRTADLKRSQPSLMHLP